MLLSDPPAPVLEFLFCDNPPSGVWIIQLLTDIFSWFVEPAAAQQICWKTQSCCCCCYCCCFCCRRCCCCCCCCYRCCCCLSHSAYIPFSSLVPSFCVFRIQWDNETLSLLTQEQLSVYFYQYLAWSKLANLDLGQGLANCKGVIKRGFNPNYP